MTTISKEQLHAALPDTCNTLNLPGMRRPVVVLRDSFGIPHVRAETEHDAFFGQVQGVPEERAKCASRLC